MSMVVMVLENVPASVRGELTRWFLEVHPGVFAGTPSAMVRDKLWEKVCGSARQGGCVLLHNDASEQGFSIKTWGPTRRAVDDYDGLKLIRRA
jgi:CRISPR-associated protein Cas2